MGDDPGLLGEKVNFNISQNEALTPEMLIYQIYEKSCLWYFSCQGVKRKRTLCRYFMDFRFIKNWKINYSLETIQKENARNN